MHLALELLARDEDDVRVRVLGGELVALVRVGVGVRVRAGVRVRVRIGVRPRLRVRVAVQDAGGVHVLERRDQLLEVGSW